MNEVPEVRIRRVNDVAPRTNGSYVLYWMVAARRLEWNFGLQRAVDLAVSRDVPLVVLEALRVGYPWASDRLHAFVMQGMADNARRSAESDIAYFPYAERRPGDGSGLLTALASRAVTVVTDDYPAFFLPGMIEAAGRRVGVRMEAVDSNGLLPMRTTERTYPSAYAFRRRLQKELHAHLRQFPSADPLAGRDLRRSTEGVVSIGAGAGFADHARVVAAGVDPAILERWVPCDATTLTDPTAWISDLPIDHDVPRTAEVGGVEAGAAVLREFIDSRLPRYAAERNQPGEEVASGLSPWLHFGHVAAHRVFAELAAKEDWSPDDCASTTAGQRQGWWGMSEAAESFVDELVTWRELGFNMCVHRPDYDQYESLPDWAVGTLGEHASDPRPHLYGLEELEDARTHDGLWNAAQTQLVREGRIHNYLRMLWGKKILEWSESPVVALAHMIELNNKYALDGRDPNSYSGIFWVLGRYDRPWGPERPIFGKVRYMSSENTARKVRVKPYLQRYGDRREPFESSA